MANNLGRLDLLIEMPKTTYVIELKLDSSPEEGLKQIIAKGYDRPYLRAREIHSTHRA